MPGGRFEEVEIYQDGETIIHEDDLSRVMFVIQQGAAVVSKKVGDEEVVLATLRRGSFFGEMSLLESLPRSATVRASGETRVLVINSGGLLLKIRRDPTFALEMLQQMSRRVRLLNEALVDLMEDQDRVISPGAQVELQRRVSEFQPTEPIDANAPE